MFPGSVAYTHEFAPERSLSHPGMWYAWNASGVLQVLLNSARVALADKPEIRILLANGSAVELHPGTPVHDALLELGRDYDVLVMRASLCVDEFEVWDSMVASSIWVDGILVRNRQVAGKAQV